MPTPVIVNGARGKMGALACESLTNHPDFVLVAALSKADDLAQAIHETKASIVVELTRADCVYENSLTIINAGAHPVIGASGLLPAQIEALTGVCDEKQLGCIIAPNFSIGALLMMVYATQAAKYLPDVEIIESHHHGKRDAPSGTAIKTAQMIAAVRTFSANQVSSCQELLPGARGCVVDNIPIHSVRLPGILAQQQVIFGALGETLSFTHNTLDRACFMPGIILACQKVTNLTTLVYGLEHLL